MKKSFKRLLITPCFGLALALGGAAECQASLVATISGQYGAPVGDTPNLFFHNSTAFAFTNVKISGQAYNGSNSLLASGIDVDKSSNLIGGAFHRTQVKNLPDVAAFSDLNYSFLDGSPACGPSSNTGSLFAWDYDDSYGCTASAAPGNVKFTFTATWDGQDIFAVFSPDDNFTGGFLGFLGLDETGNAESGYDAGGAVSGTGQFGTLAQIFTGTPPQGVPEPSSFLLLGIALFGLTASKLSRKS
ncbi:MAG: PEP-CTERM sorting domain-containing protein [Pseudomonadota bacterium]|nr:PEP-CTERM sorting domain-containing protein [Pseudomonadota bacterium]